MAVPGPPVQRLAPCCVSNGRRPMTPDFSLQFVNAVLNLLATELARGSDLQTAREVVAERYGLRVADVRALTWQVTPYRAATANPVALANTTVTAKNQSLARERRSLVGNNTAHSAIPWAAPIIDAFRIAPRMQHPRASTPNDPAHQPPLWPRTVTPGFISCRPRSAGQRRSPRP
jgi:hypothetical protein